MPKKPKKMEDYVFPFAASLVALVYGTFFVTLGIDITRVARYIGSLYATNL